VIETIFKGRLKMLIIVEIRDVAVQKISQMTGEKSPNTCSKKSGSYIITF
jgi:hypothetical protein